MVAADSTATRQGTLRQVPDSARGGLNIHLYPSTLTHESRMRRMCTTIRQMSAFDDVEMVGIDGPGLPPTEHQPHFRVRRISRHTVPGPRFLRKIVQTLSWYFNVLRRYWPAPVGCVNCHSVAVLPLALLLKLRHQCPIVYDTHELETESMGARGAARIVYKLIERFGIHRVDSVVVVSDSIADWYVSAYGIRRPLVVRNVPERAAPLCRDRGLLRGRLGIPADHLVFMYHGGLFTGRRIDQYVRIFKCLPPDRHVVFMGYGELESLIRQAAATCPNIHFLPAVDPEDVIAYAAGADVGLHGLEPRCLSYRLALPNKVFESLAGGVPILSNDLPEIARLVQRYRCGWILGDGDQDWFRSIAELTRDDIDAARCGAERATTAFTWALERERLRPIYAQ
jgi:glycosyltransferase involved in cell wall biosynthesis